MASRRMFAKSIVQSSRFLKMPVSSRELYFQLGMSADDDGIVEAWNTMKLTNAREDDLRVLVSKGYVQILNNEDLIAYLTDWNTNNSIRTDRKHDSIYKDLLLMISNNDNQLATTCQPYDNQCETEVRLGKDSIGKDRSGKVNNSCTESKNDSEQKPVKYADVPLIPLNDGSEWAMPLELYEEYKKIYPAVNITAEIGRMRMWSLSNPKNKKTSRGVARFVNSWLSKEQDKHHDKNPSNSGVDDLKI